MPQAVQAQQRQTKFVNYIRHLEMTDRLYAKDGPDRLYANRQKRAASGPREYPTKQPISTKGHAVGNCAHKLRWISFLLLVAQ
jgi:hypothetical protein